MFSRSIFSFFLEKKKKFNSWRFYSLLRVDFFFAREITFNFVVRVLCQISKFQHSHSVHVHTTKIPTYPRVGLTVRLSVQSVIQPVRRSIVRLQPYLWVYFDSVRFASDWLGLAWFCCELVCCCWSYGICSMFAVSSKLYSDNMRGVVTSSSSTISTQVLPCSRTTHSG